MIAGGQNNPTWDPLYPTSPLSPANPFSPVNPDYWGNNAPRLTGPVSQETCSCLSGGFCQKLDEVGNKNGTPEWSDLPSAAAAFQSLLSGTKISPARYTECIARRSPQRVEHTEKKQTPWARATRAITGGAGLGVVAGGGFAIFGLEVLAIPAGVALGFIGAGLVIGAIAGYFYYKSSKS